MEFDTEFLEQLSYCQPGQIYEDYRVVAKDVVDEWRWGNVYLLVFNEVETQDFWGFTFQTSSGDGEYTSFDDWGKTRTVNRYASVEVVTTQWVRLPRPSGPDSVGS